MTSNMAVAAIYRYPVKGLSAERMDRVTLMPGECLPHDRRFAIALGSTHFDPESPEWLSKTHFIMLMRDEKLAQLQTRFDTESGVLGIAEDGRVLLRARLTEAEGCKRIAEFFENFLGGTVNGPLRVVEAPRHAFADARPKPNATTEKDVSLINPVFLDEIHHPQAGKIAQATVFIAAVWPDGTLASEGTGFLVSDRPTAVPKDRG